MIDDRRHQTLGLANAHFCADYFVMGRRGDFRGRASLVALNILMKIADFKSPAQAISNNDGPPQSSGTKPHRELYR